MRKLSSHDGRITILLVLVFIWAGLVIDRVRDHTELIQGAIDKATNFAVAFEEQVSLSLNGFDQILLSARLIGGLMPEHKLVDHLIKTNALHKAIFNLSFYDEIGNLAYTTAKNAPANTNIADRSWFLDFRDGGKDSFYISQPIDSRASGKLSVIVARGVWHADGRFAGIVGMSIDPSYFGDFYRRINLGPHGLITLTGTDGIQRIRVASGTIMYGVDTTGSPSFLASQQSDAGMVLTTCRVDHIERYISYRVLKGFPLIVSVGISLDDTLDVFNQDTAIAVGVAIMFSVIFIWVAQISRIRLSTIAKQAAELAEARDRADQSDRLKSEFIANMSHELRTPLNAIIGFSELLIGSTRCNLTPSVIKNLEHIRNAGCHLLDLVTSVLEISKIESGSYEVHCEDVDLQALTQDCLAMTSVLIAQKAIAVSVRFSDGCCAWCDPIRTRQAMLNILSNAVKYGDDFGIISIAGVRLESGQIEVTVSDTGIGMTAEELVVAMAPFAQVSSGSAKAYGGTGLGLPLTKRLIEIQGGAFAIDSVKGKGTTVTIRLPVAPSPASLA